MPLQENVKNMEINSIAVGRDGRLSGPVLLESFCEGLLEAGIDVNNIGLVTSPLAIFCSKKRIIKKWNYDNRKSQS